MESTPNPAPGQPTPTGEISKDERTMAMLCHILGIPTGFVGPLVIWLIKKDTMPFVDEQGKEALNFHITVFIAYVISAVLMSVFIGCVLMPIVIIGALILTIMATIQANEGKHYRYPVALRLIK